MEVPPFFSVSSCVPIASFSVVRLLNGFAETLTPTLTADALGPFEGRASPSTTCTNSTTLSDIMPIQCTASNKLYNIFCTRKICMSTHTPTHPPTNHPLTHTQKHIHQHTRTLAHKKHTHEPKHTEMCTNVYIFAAIADVQQVIVEHMHTYINTYTHANIGLLVHTNTYTRARACTNTNMIEPWQQ